MRASRRKIGRRLGSACVQSTALAAFAMAAHAQTTEGKVSKHDRSSALKLAGELLLQVQASLQAGADNENCRAIIPLKSTDSLYKSLLAMNDRHIKDVALFNDGTYLEMALEGGGRTEKLAVIVRIVDEKCATFEAAKAE